MVDFCMNIALMDPSGLYVSLRLFRLVRIHRSDGCRVVIRTA